MTQVVHDFSEMAEALKAQGFTVFLPSDKKAKSAVAKQSAKKAEMLATKDKSLLRGFARKGISGVVLMDRTDRSKPFNVRPYGRKNEDGTYTGWLGEGRQVRQGETSVRGLFHESQTDELPKATA